MSLFVLILRNVSYEISLSNVSYRLLQCLFILSLPRLVSCGKVDDLLNIRPNDTSTIGSEVGVIKFIAIGDTGKGNEGQRFVADAIKNKCAQDGCDFIIMLGDNIYDDGVEGTDHPQFQTKFEIPYQDINLPFFLVLGNHDYGGGGAGYEVLKSIYQIQYTEKSEKWNMPRHYYQFRKGNINFYALDTNAQLFGRDDDQRKDVANWLAASNTQWNIAFGHHPYHSNGPHGNAGHYDGLTKANIINGNNVKTFAENIWCGKVDIYLSGHDHNRQWLNTDCNGTKMIVSGAGASTTQLEGNNPVLFQKATLGFLYIRIEGNKLTGQFVDVTGNVEFSHVLDRIKEDGN